jgi:crotonobetainyl-CoA:carnitine CoA-transferase CaiB-like acyl-CoA transferase
MGVVSEARTRPEAPLAGLRVIDLSRVLAGPACGRLLADLGADVIKVEPPSEDVSRHVAPKDDRGMSGLYTLANAGKRNVCIELRAPGGVELVLELVRRADVAIENFRPGVLERLGLGWEVIHRANPRALLLSINGYGSASAWADRAAYAPAVHAQAGVLSYQAEWTGLPLSHIADNKADMSAALHGTIALLAALHAARLSGRGQRVEVPLFDALLSTYSETPFALLPEPRHRDETPLFDAGEYGIIAIAGSMQNAWHRLKLSFGLEDPAAGEPDVPTKRRLRQRAIERWMRSAASLEELFGRVEKAGLGCARIESLRDALTGPLAQERDLLVHVDDRRGGTRPVVRAPYWFSGVTCPVRRPAPRRGEHNAEVLREVLGYDDERIAQLVDSGALCAADPASR